MSDGAIFAGFLESQLSLAGRSALIIGGHGDLARAMAAGLADRGCAITLAARKLDQCQALAQEITTIFGTQANAMQCDVLDAEQVRAAVASIVETYGRLDILVNNAGTSWSGASEDLPLEGWNKCMDVNLTGNFLSAQAAGKVMLAQGSGSIIMVASVGGLRSYMPEIARIAPYSTSKAGVIQLSRNLAAEWADRGVRVNALLPGQMEAGMTVTVSDDVIERVRNGIPMRRLGQPSELSAAVAYLASDAASYVTGHAMIVDGGMTLI